MFFVNPLWFLCVSHLKSLWFLCGFLMESLWLLLQCHYVRLRDWAPHQHDWPSICKAYGMACESLINFFVNPLWFLCGSHLKSLRFLCGFLLESLWLLLPCHYVRLKDWAQHTHMMWPSICKAYGMAWQSLASSKIHKCQKKRAFLMTKLSFKWHGQLANNK